MSQGYITTSESLTQHAFQWSHVRKDNLWLIYSLCSGIGWEADNMPFVYSSVPGQEWGKTPRNSNALLKSLASVWVPFISFRFLMQPRNEVWLVRQFCFTPATGNKRKTDRSCCKYLTLSPLCTVVTARILLSITGTACKVNFHPIHQAKGKFIFNVQIPLQNEQPTCL